MPVSVLASDDPPPVQHWREQGAANVILACDHASNRVPRALQGLGLGAAELLRHIAWDIGAAEVTRRLAVLLDAPAILAGYSRLVIDCNRAPEDQSSIPETSDGVAIPGNRGIAPAARAARQEQIFAPYHAAVERAIAARIAQRRVPAFVSIHSFTPVMGGKARPWHVGILWDSDPRMPQPLLAALSADPSLVVGDNEPYSAREPQGYTVRTHAALRGLPHVAIELRQDLVADEAGAARWAGILGAALAPILARAELYRVRSGG